MKKVSKNRKKIIDKVVKGKLYSVDEASSLVKEITSQNFDPSVDLAVRLGVDPKKADQMIRGVVSLPNGTGKSLKILALVTPDLENDAKEAGADFVGLDDYLNKIKGGWTDVDVIITVPSVMPKLGPLGKILGPRGLMPNPKSGTVTNDVKKAVTDVKSGKIDFKVDKFGIIHVSVAKASFSPQKISENINEFLRTVLKLKPSSAKGNYFKSIFISTTMSPSIQIDNKIFN
ncbi:MAG: 50S ribosomal protein L1 [Flavobacteriaceae bacterium]|jgi:large subunit ribosomal protein L1|nr:50S ribosomal protein L1 [Flavobacteriaceae bacterium]|tara:strand:+ start:1264 stop:1956 length:693 start_codon:yes stop_codon:yes gene_type:complete